MKYNFTFKICGLILLLLSCSEFTSCEKSKPVIATSVVEIPPIPLQVPTLSSHIHKVDFKNFSYPEPNYGYRNLEKSVGNFRISRTHYRLIEGGQPEIRGENGMLKNSPASLSFVEYVELTGDKEQEALVTLSIQTGGSAMANNLYCYKWQNHKPKLIFTFSAGDRADGGYRNMYADSGDLIIELNAGDEKAPDCDGCQSTRFLRLRYKWDGRKFVKVNQELLPIK